MNRITTSFLKLGGTLAVAGLVSAQTPQTPPPAPASKPGAAAAAPDSDITKAPPVGSAITAPTDPNKVVLSINGTKMTARQFDEMMRAFPAQIQQAANGPQRRKFIEQYVQLRVAADEATHRNLEKEPEVQQQLALQHDNVLAGALYQDLLKTTKVTDADIQKYYDTHKNKFETAKAHHVLIRFKGSAMPAPKDKKELTDEEALAKAKDVQKRLLAGEDFAKVAKEASDDTNTAGGDLGSFSKGQMVGPFDDAVFTLPIGKVSDPIKTQFGYHIIRVDSRETKTVDLVKAQIEQELRPEIAKKDIEDLRSKANVTIDEDFFKPAAAQPGATGR